VYETLFRDGAVQKAGMEPTYSARASLAQPDFTAECLQARNSGVEVLVVIMDANSVGRVADSCTRQAFRPAYTSGGLIVTNQLASNTNLDGLVATMPTFSWVASGTPATDEYQQAMNQFAPNLTPAASTSAVWASGQLLAKAMGLGSDATSAGILHGLWQIRGESLGGLVAPLTFEANKPAPPVDCYFITQIRQRKWVAFNDGRPSC
jgi:branched-chain amino acid transport system substrate-binding protein